MNYQEIIENLAKKEKVTVQEIENEMQKAICCAGLECSAEEFIRITAELVKEKTIYSNIV